MELKKLGPGVSEEKSFKGVDGRTDGQRTDDGRQLITVTHPETSAQVSLTADQVLLI